MGFQISKGHVFRPENPLLWLQSDSGEMTYFFYTNKTITMQSFDADGAPLTSSSILANHVNETGSIFATQLGDGNYLLSYRDLFYRDDGLSYTAHYDVYNSAGILLHSETESYEGSGYRGVAALENVNDSRVELFSSFLGQSDAYYLNYFDANGGRIAYQLQSDRPFVPNDHTPIVLNDYTPKLLSLGTDGFALAVSTRSSQVNSSGFYDSGAELQFFTADGQKSEDTFFLPTLTTSYRYTIGDFEKNSAGNYVVEVINSGAKLEQLQTQYIIDTAGNIISEVEIPKINKNVPGIDFDVVDPQILNLADGGWIVEWGEGHIGWDTDNGMIDSFYFQRFDSSGSAVGKSVTIDPGPRGWFGSQVPSLRLTSLTSGSFVATWFARDDVYSDFNGWQPLPMQRVFDAHGMPLTKVAPISSEDFHSQVMNVESLSGDGWRVDFMDGSYKEFHLSDLDSAPFAATRKFVLWEDQPQHFNKYNIIYSDVDGDKAKQVIISTLPGSGTLTIHGNPVVAGQAISYNKLHELVYTPPENVHSYNLTDIGFKVIADGSGLTSKEAFLHVRIMSVNDLPTSQDFTVSIRENSTYHFRENQFKFFDVEDQQINDVMIVKAPRHGWLFLGKHQITGGWIKAEDIHKLRYVPIDDYLGHDVFKFKVTDSLSEYPRYGNEVHIDVREAKSSSTSAVDNQAADKMHHDSAPIPYLENQMVDASNLSSSFHQHANSHNIVDSWL